ncbi:KINESIN-RELATED [Salix purpurea]|uniref:KINESIN-RELATED n=1 Tax=Salix purpurea TaxID=77065 RepID=A0A9Q0VT31_SALPP|nr:KINESIN-RELATED [Salix purpurea]
MTGVARKQDLNINPKVRFIAKIRSSSHPDGLSNSWISVNNILRDGVFSHSLSFSLGDHPLATSNRMGPCVVDYCYDQNEKNDVVFEREVKPSIDEVFDGCNATIIACGASGSGKSYLFQGTNDEPGLIVLAVNGMLRLAANNRKSVAASFYEVDHDHNVKDLLDPNRQVFVLKDAHGKTQLKGLSQVLVTSMSQFHNFYGRATNSRKSIPERSHKGLILYVSSDVGEKLNVVVSKLNFVDLAGYQDARNKSLDGHNLAESTTNINKSIHVMHNVLYSLKANETHVPYRESKITNMLQDSLRGTGRILMVTCLNPSFCHDSINMVRLASRSCQGTSWAITDSSKKANSLARPMVPSSHKIWMHGSASTSARKQTMSRGHIYRNKAHCSTSTMKAGKLFGESSDLKSQKTGDDNSKIALSTGELSMFDEAVPSHSLCNECGLPPLSAQLQEIVNKLRSICSSIPSCMDTTPHNDGFHTATSTDIAELTTLKSNMRTDDDNNKIAVSTRELPMFDEGKKIGKESSCSICNLDRSALHIKEFEEIVNNMKSICSSTSSCIDIPPHDDALHAQTSTDIGEPATLNSSMGVSDRDITSFSTWEKFIAGSTGMKNSLAQDYLRLLNTADKEVLQKLKGIGEKRATYILELREDNPEPFKNLDDLKVIGLSTKQVRRWL